MALHPCHEQDQVLLAPGLIDDAAPQVRPYEAQHGADALLVGVEVLKEIRRAVRIRIAAPQRLLDRGSRLAANPLDQRRLKADRQRFDRALGADARRVDLPVVQDEEVVVVDRDHAAVDAAILGTAPGCPDRQGVGVRPELRTPRATPDDATFPAPSGMELALELGVLPRGIGQ